MSKWSDNAFLNKLRDQGDALADKCAREIHEREDFAYLFREMNANDEPLPTDAPAPMRRFFDQTHELPPGTDEARIASGERVFMTHAFTAALVLLAKSLPAGYAAPNLSQILSLSGDLDRVPYRRLLGVLQMVVNVCTQHGFQTGGKAVVTAQKLRLLHAGIRVHIVPKHLPRFQEKFGVPVNFEDMLATLMGLSYLVITGLQRLDVGLRTQQAEDLYYLWRVFAQLMGIHPEGRPESTEYVPLNLTEAGEFYAAYERRHYVDASDNPEGVKLAAENLRMLQDFVPAMLRRAGLTAVPRVYMYDLLGADCCARVGVKPVLGHYVLQGVLVRIPRGLQTAVTTIDPSGGVHERWSRFIFQDMITRQYDGQVTFALPERLSNLRTLETPQGN